MERGSQMTIETTGRPLTGRHVLMITVGAFAVIIGVNLTMAYQAIRTFPGLEVANSYVASQSFDRDRMAQQALGWTVTQGYGKGGVALHFAGPDGAPVQPASLIARVGRSTEAADDQDLIFVATGLGDYRAPALLGRGKWVVMVQATSANGTAFRQRLYLVVAKDVP